MRVGRPAGRLGEDGRVTSPVRHVVDPLSVAALDIERHVAASGWDQPPRLFALVRTAALLEREPQLRAGLAPADLVPGALTAVEPRGRLADALAAVAHLGFGAGTGVAYALLPPSRRPVVPW